MTHDITVKYYPYVSISIVHFGDIFCLYSQQLGKEGPVKPPEQVFLLSGWSPGLCPQGGLVLSVGPSTSAWLRRLTVDPERGQCGVSVSAASNQSRWWYSSAKVKSFDENILGGWHSSVIIPSSYFRLGLKIYHYHIDIRDMEIQDTVWVPQYQRYQ